MLANHYLSSVSDEVSLGDSCYKEDSEIVVKKVNFKYTQKNSIKGIERRFVLFNDVYLQCMVKNNAKKQPNHRLDLTFLDLKPTKSLVIAWKTLISGVLFLILSALAKTDIVLSFLPVVSVGILPVSTLLAMLAACLLLLSYYKSHYNLVFRSYAGRVPLLVLSPKPARKNYRQFIKLLMGKIQFAQGRNKLTIRDRLVGEMKDLRRLKDIGIVQEKDYTIAQSRILKHKYYTG